MNIWHVARDAGTEGPFAEEEVAKRIEAGDFSRGDLVWKPGLKTWEPIELHFKCKAFVFFPSFDVKAGGKAEADVVSGVPCVKRKCSSGIFLHGLSVVFLFLCFLFFYKIYNAIGLLNFYLSFTVFVLVSVVNALFFFWRLWSIAAAQEEQKGGFAGGKIKIFCILFSIVLAIFSFAVIPVANTAYRIAQVRKSYEKYTLDVNPVTDVITISGLVGPNLSNKLESLLRLHTNTRAIVITSPGGLVDEALMTAKVIEKHKNISLIARKQCNSACIAVFMSTERRFADYDMTFGFHGVSLIMDVNKNFYDLESLNEDMSSYLVKRGVPRDIVVKASQKKKGELDLIPAIDLADRKVVSGLLDGDARISSSEAKWKVLEGVLAVFDTPEGEILASILRIVRKGHPRVVEEKADDLYRSLKAESFDRLLQAARSVFQEIAFKALLAADGDVLLRHVNVIVKQVEYLKAVEAWGACSRYLEGDAEEAVRILPKSMVLEEVSSLERLIKSAASRNWAVQPVSERDKQRGAEIVGAVLAALLKLGRNIDNLEKNHQDNCITQYVLYKAIIQEGAEKAPPIMRWISSLGRQEVNPFSPDAGVKAKELRRRTR